MLSTLLANPLGLIAALSPLIVKSIDNNRARIDQASKLLDEEMKAANDLAAELMAATDRILFLNKEAMFGIVFRGVTVKSITEKTASDLDSKAWLAYQSETALWNSSKTTRLARIYGTFNDETVRLFSALSVQAELLENMVSAAFYMRMRSKYFIRDTEAKNGSNNSETNDQVSPDSPLESKVNVDFVIQTLGIDADVLSGLVGSIRKQGSGKPVPKAKQTDFRYKYFPVYDNCLKDLFAVGALMLAQIQNQQVGALRKERPPIFNPVPSSQPAPALNRNRIVQTAAKLTSPA